MAFVGDANDPATILADAHIFFSSYFAASDDDEVQGINAGFTGATAPPYWWLGRLTSALVQVYDLVAPLDAEKAGRYLDRLGRFLRRSEHLIFHFQRLVLAAMA